MLDISSLCWCIIASQNIITLLVAMGIGGGKIGVVVGVKLLVLIVSLLLTWFSPRCPLSSHSLVCIENNLFIVGIGPFFNKELEFIFRCDRSDRTCVYI